MAESLNSSAAVTRFVEQYLSFDPNAETKSSLKSIYDEFMSLNINNLEYEKKLGMISS